MDFFEAPPIILGGFSRISGKFVVYDIAWPTDSEFSSNGKRSSIIRLEISFWKVFDRVKGWNHLE